ncbi:MAG: Cytochrome-c3 hydrogenase subunit gamma [Parcubacteria group bacterium GW2011_GWC2_39_14]|nr:MAG: Cytochrome-c3 hydrogenase subunit gamma [Parcubacteria group bacterium GW2011_GWC2_39_14]KKR54415.1 MAG: Cytochrome-c3 hydrogenase subunit gamma [Parcubacteria group bacterium GW2011_GWA2_40_23]
MKNVYEIFSAKIIKVTTENPTTKTLFLKLKDQSKFQFLAGQFMMIGLPGFGECPISISSAPQNASNYFTLTIRTVGELTEKLNSFKVGETVFVRGPFGNGFPQVTKNLILIGGGCGYIPLRSVYEENKNRKDIKMQILIGCRDEDSLVFESDYESMNKKHELGLIMEKPKSKKYGSAKGFVTDLIKKVDLLPDALVFLCGPAIMYGFVVKELLEKGVNLSNIYLSLEKRMHCGLGVCQHCAIGSKYVCKDGPVFNAKYLKSVNYI